MNITSSEMFCISIICLSVATVIAVMRDDDPGSKLLKVIAAVFFPAAVAAAFIVATVVASLAGIASIIGAVSTTVSFFIAAFYLFIVWYVFGIKGIRRKIKGAVESVFTWAKNR